MEPETVGAAAEDASSWRSVDDLMSRDSAAREPAVLLVDQSMLRRRDWLTGLPRSVLFVAVDEESEAALPQRVALSLVGAVMPAARRNLVAAACKLSRARHVARRRRRQLARHKRERRQISQVGMALMEERDHDQLLDRLLAVGKHITRSDLAGLLLAEADGDDKMRLRVVRVASDTIEEIEIGDRTGAVDDTSIIGHSARTKRPIVVADAYDLPADASFIMDPSFDERYRYRRRSMLIAPMVDHHQRLVGVMVFVNRKSDMAAKISNKEMADRYVRPYQSRQVRLARSLAGQAAVSIENARLNARIEQMLESVVRASVTAIDQRDPATAGHSLRVAELTRTLAEAVNRTTRGPYQDVRFTKTQMRELHYAALLHDFGKIGVREAVLLKAKKLPPLLWERIDARFNLICRTLELDFCKNDSSQNHGDHAASLEAVRRMRDVVRAANEPGTLDRESSDALAEIAKRTFESPGGEVSPYLTCDELHYLQLANGTLDSLERAEIESHVDETYQYLVKIPWTDDLQNVVSYAYGHHEKLDGTGYPRHLTADEIPLQMRIITLTDIFDALTESDRPYKRAVAPAAALDILRTEAKRGLLDADLVELMAEIQSAGSFLDADRPRRDSE
jgi:HD-GYP domain-containing protein (c-di-GMP phosphodiesterase class II)